MLSVNVTLARLAREEITRAYYGAAAGRWDVGSRTLHILMQESGVEGHPVRIEARVWVGPPFEAEDRRTMALFSLPVPLEQATDLRSARKLLRAAARRMESIVFAAIEDAKQ